MNAEFAPMPQPKPPILRREDAGGGPPSRRTVRSSSTCALFEMLEALIAAVDETARDEIGGSLVIAGEGKASASATTSRRYYWQPYAGIPAAPVPPVRQVRR